MKSGGMMDSDALVSAGAESRPGRNWFALLVNLCLLALWLWLYRLVYPYLGLIFTRQEFRTNQVVLLAVLALVAWQFRRGNFHPRLDALPQLNVTALVLALGGSLAYLLSERFLDINTLSASLFGLSSYGLLGLWLRPRYWRRGLPAALLIVGALPFGEHMQTFIGYPVRILTAAIVRAGLDAVGFQSIGVDTILVFENGISQVDLPCSGVQSLWTGGLFLLAATWIERRPLNRRWLLLAGLFAFLLLAANLARVAILVAVGVAFDLRLLAEMLHVPLGVLGFAAACAAALAMLHRLGDPQGSAITGEPAAELTAHPPRPAWLAPALSATVLLMALLVVPRPPTASAQSDPGWQLPPELHAEIWSLSPRELEWLTRDGQAQAARWRFRWGDLSGSMLFVSSRTWRSQHRPERCFEVYGLTVDSSQALFVSPDFPLRLLTLSGSQQSASLSAVYWLQSSDRLTEDYAARIWADVSPQPRRWVLVTVLFDGDMDLNNPQDMPGSQPAALFAALRQAVARNLEGGVP